MRYSLNFGVPTEPEASELPKGLALGRDGNIHIRITPLGDVGSHMKTGIDEEEEDDGLNLKQFYAWPNLILSQSLWDERLQ